jgi:hypothetical protein
MTILVPMPEKKRPRQSRERMEFLPVFQPVYKSLPVLEDNLYEPMLMAAAAAGSPGGSGDHCLRCMSAPCICYTSLFPGFDGYNGVNDLAGKLGAGSYKNLDKKEFGEYGTSLIDVLFEDAFERQGIEKKIGTNIPNKMKPEDPFGGYGK